MYNSGSVRYVLRNENFGAIIYDRVNKDYLHFDTLSVRLLLDPRSTLTRIEKETYKCADNTVPEILNELEYLNIFDNFECLDNEPRPNSLSAPLRIFYEITYRCTEHCSFCFTNSGNIQNNELEFPEKLSILDQLLEMGCYRISIAGGEPLIDKDFFPFIEATLARGIDVSFSTNGILVTENIANRLANYDIRTINVSLDGWNQKSYEQIRGQGRFKKFICGVQALRRGYPFRLAAKCTIMTPNIAHLDKVIDFAQSLGFDMIKFNCLRESGRAIQNSFMVPSQGEYVKAIQQLSKQSSNGGSGIKIALPLNPFSRRLKEGSDFINRSSFGCYAGKESFCIRADGTIQPCTSFAPDLFVDGNIRSRSLKEIWDYGTSIREFRNRKGNNECLKCNSFSGCRGGCSYRSFIESGDINALDPYCYEFRNC